MIPFVMLSTSAVAQVPRCALLMISWHAFVAYIHIPAQKNANVPRVAVNRAIMPACLPHKFVTLLSYSAIVDDALRKWELFNINLRDVMPFLLNYFCRCCGNCSNKQSSICRAASTMNSDRKPVIFSLAQRECYIQVISLMYDLHVYFSTFQNWMAAGILC